MPTTLDPIDREGNAYRVLLDGKRIGTVTRNITLGHTMWQHQARDEDPPQGVFEQKEHAADQLAADYLQRKKK
jgi:hypothetical protein